MKCGKCKYWGDEVRDQVEARNCLKAKQLWDCTTWGDESSDYERIMLPEFKDLKMFVQDGSDYRATLFTKEDFFCAHFEGNL